MNKDHVDRACGVRQGAALWGAIDAQPHKAGVVGVDEEVTSGVKPGREVTGSALVDGHAAVEDHLVVDATYGLDVVALDVPLEGREGVAAAEAKQFDGGGASAAVQAEVEDRVAGAEAILRQVDPMPSLR